MAADSSRRKESLPGVWDLKAKQRNLHSLWTPGFMTCGIMRDNERGWQSTFHPPIRKAESRLADKNEAGAAGPGGAARCGG